MSVHTPPEKREFVEELVKILKGKGKYKNVELVSSAIFCPEFSGSTEYYSRT